MPIAKRSIDEKLGLATHALDDPIDCYASQPATHTITMLLLTAAKLLFSASLLGSAAAHNIQLPAHGRECFHESLHREDRMTVTFQVGDREFGGAGNLEVDFWVRLFSWVQ